MQNNAMENDITLFPGEKFEEVTSQFKEACISLSQGELAKAEHFSLLDGVHALEIWDERMDTGLQFVPLSEELQKVNDSFDPNNLEKLIELMDKLVGREMAWHKGSILTQCVFSCVYVEDILCKITKIKLQAGIKKEIIRSRLDEFLDINVQGWKDVLTVYILGLVKAVHLAIEIMDPSQNQAIYPDEDIVVNTYDLSVLEDFSIDQVVKILERAIRWIGAVPSSSAHNELAKQVSNRLKLRTEWLYILHQKIAPKSTRHFDEALRLIKGVKESLSTKPKTDKETEDIASIVISVLEPNDDACFSQGVQSRVTNASPLRPLTTIPAENVYTLLQSVIQVIYGFRKITDIKRTADLLGFFLQFSQTYGIPLTRAILKSTVSETAIVSEPVRDWVVRDITELVGFPQLSKVLSTKSPVAAEPLVTTFIQQASLCLSDLFSIMCHNRPRQRQNLAHCIVSWDGLQVSAEQLDNYLSKELGTPDAAVTSWVFARKLEIMTWVVLMGFELDLYKSWEFSTMYFYLHYLLTNLIAHLSEIRSTLNSIGQREAGAYVQSLELEARALDMLAQASMCLAIESKQTIPAHVMTSPDLLYGLRMKSFSSVGVPELPTYDKVQEFVAGDKALKGNAALDMAKSCADSSRRLLDHLAGLSQTNTYIDFLKRSCIGISIQSMMYRKRKETSRIVVKRQGFHPYFPVLTLEND